MPHNREYTGTDELMAKDPMGLYLQAVNRIPLLDAEQEVELAKTIEAGLYAEKVIAGSGGNSCSKLEATEEELAWLIEAGQQAKNEFIEANQRLVISIAQKYHSQGVPILDLIQEGNIGLLIAVEKFDYKKGYKFSTYATPWIKKMIKICVARQAGVISMPVGAAEEINSFNRTVSSLEASLGRKPQPEEVAREFNVTIEHVKTLIKRRGLVHVSLDSPVYDDTTFGDLKASDGPTVEELVEETDMVRILYVLLALLEQSNPNEAMVIRARCGIDDGVPKLQLQISWELGVSRVRTGQIERRALQRLREWVVRVGLEV